MGASFDEARKPFGPETEADTIRLINSYTASMPFSKPITPDLIAHWKTLGDHYQPDKMALVYGGREPRAFIHGEMSKKTYFIHLVAMARGAVADGLRLVAEAEVRARADGAERLVGPTCPSGVFYGGYICGLEPYHSDRGIEGTDLYVQAGFRLKSPEVILVAGTAGQTEVREVPKEYELIEVKEDEEYEARTFCYVAMRDGEKVAFSSARLYPRLLASSGGPVGQIGPVGTNELHRNKGLATALTQLCLRRLREWGAAETLITTNVDNLSAIKAYERAGFRRRHLVIEWEKRLT